MREKKPNDLEKAHSVPHSEYLLFPSLLYVGFAPSNTKLLTNSTCTCGRQVVFGDRLSYFLNSNHMMVLQGQVEQIRVCQTAYWAVTHLNTSSGISLLLRKGRLAEKVLYRRVKVFIRDLRPNWSCLVHSYPTFRSFRWLPCFLCSFEGVLTLTVHWHNFILSKQFNK